MKSENKEQYEWLALRCQSRDAGAFEDLIAVMERPLLYYAASLAGNTDSAIDVLQEVWINAFRANYCRVSGTRQSSLSNHYLLTTSVQNNL